MKVAAMTNLMVVSFAVLLWELYFSMYRLTILYLHLELNATRLSYNSQTYSIFSYLINLRPISCNCIMIHHNTMYVKLQL